MKKLITILLFSFSLVAFSQQDPLYSQYQFNQLMINPAYAGIYNRFSVGAITRFQWAGIEGSPTVSYTHLDDFAYTSGNEKSYVYGLSGADFTTGESSLSFPSDFGSFYEVRYTGSFYSEFLLRGGSSVVGTVGQMAAPIHLPQGATITQIEVFGRNNSTSNAMTVTLYQASFSTGSSNTAIGTIPINTGTVARQINNTGLSISVDNVNVKYTLVIDAEIGALGITGVKIHYTKTTLD